MTTNFETAKSLLDNNPECTITYTAKNGKVYHVHEVSCYGNGNGSVQLGLTKHKSLAQSRAFWITIDEFNAGSIVT
jgi:hypothetical protein